MHCFKLPGMVAFSTGGIYNKYIEPGVAAGRFREGSMAYLTVAMWFIIGIILIVSMGKENKIFYFAGAYFLALGVWWLLDILLPAAKMFKGSLGIYFKVGSGAVFIVLMSVFLLDYRKNLRKTRRQEAEMPEQIPDAAEIQSWAAEEEYQEPDQGGEEE